MATRVGTPLTESQDSPASSTVVTSGTKNTTTGNTLIMLVKWERSDTTSTLNSVTDTAGNTYIIRSQVQFSTISDPGTALVYAENITGNAANAITLNFSNTPSYVRVVLEEWSGLAASSSLDGAAVTNTGNGTSFSTGDITTTTSGLVVMIVGGFIGLSSWDGTPATPDFTVGGTISDVGFLYLISGSAQTVSPAASATGSSNWIAIAQAFKDAGGGGTPESNYWIRGVKFGAA